MIMKLKTKIIWIRTLSGISQNLAAFWFGAAFLTPGFFRSTNWLSALIGYIIYGSMFLYISIYLQKKYTI